MPMASGDGVVERVDRWQQRHRVPSFLVALARRYREDQGRQYGALLSYYGFVSLFPLLIVLATLLGIILKDDPALRDRILDTVYARIPVVGAQLREDPESLETNGVVLLVGLVVSLWSGLAVVRIAGDALNLQWAVPRFKYRFVARQLRALGALAVLGVGIIAATAATSLAAFFPDLPTADRWIGAGLAIIINIVVLTVSFRVLVKAHVSWRAFLPGGCVGGVGLWFLQLIGGTYVANVIVGASDVYGAFAAAFGLLVWIALLARVTLLANEINVVRTKRLWPRGLVPGRPTDADLRSFDEVMRREALLADAGVTLPVDDSTAHAG